MSADALDLFEKLLCLDPLKRLSAKEALQHPFVQVNRDSVCPLTLPKSQGTLYDLSIVTSIEAFIVADCHELFVKNQRKGKPQPVPVTELPANASQATTNAPAPPRPPPPPPTALVCILHCENLAFF